MLTLGDGDTPGVNRVRRSVMGCGKRKTKADANFGQRVKRRPLDERSQPKKWAEWPTVVGYCEAYDYRRRTF